MEFLGSIAARLIKRTSVSPSDRLKGNLHCRFVGWVTRVASHVGKLTSPARPIFARHAKFPSCRTLLGSSKSRKRTRRSRVVRSFNRSFHSSSRSTHDWRAVAQQFKRSWRHTTPCPKVRAIYKIIPTQQNLDKYNAYRYVVTSPSPKTRPLTYPQPPVIPWKPVATSPQ